MPSEEDIAQQQKLLAIHRNNLKHHLAQKAHLGVALTPIGIINDITAERQQIRRVKGILRGWNIAADDHPDDEPPANESAPAGAARAGQPATTEIGRDQINAQQSQGTIVSASGPVDQNFGQQNTTNAGTVIHIHGGDFRSANVPLGNNIQGDVNQQTGGATMGGPFGGQVYHNVAGNVYNIVGDLNIGAGSGKDELLAALKQLRAEFDKAQDLPPDKADEMKEDLDSTMKAVDKPQPNKERAVERLTTIQKVLDGLKDNVGSALALGKLVGQVLLAVQGIQLPF